MLVTIILATFFGGTLSLLGGALLLWNEKFAQRISLFFVSFAIGTMTAAAFLELLPEAVAESSYNAIAPYIILGIFAFFLFEKVLHWYHVHEDNEDHAHAHNEQQDHHAAGAVVMLGDTVHNFIDGVALAISWMTNPALGLATTMAIFFHEIPQEMGDFGTMLHLGYSRAKVLWYNIVSSLASVIGAVGAYYFMPIIKPFTPNLLAFAAGSFLYIAISDLLPELHHHRTRRRDLAHLTGIALGIALVVLGAYYFHE